MRVVGTKIRAGFVLNKKDVFRKFINITTLIKLNWPALISSSAGVSWQMYWTMRDTHRVEPCREISEKCEIRKKPPANENYRKECRMVTLL